MNNLNELAIKGKSIDRVPKCYEKYPEEWKAQYNMLLPDGITCKECIHCVRCDALYDQKETATSCQFYPSRFVIKHGKKY